MSLKANIASSTKPWAKLVHVSLKNDSDLSHVLVEDSYFIKENSIIVTDSHHKDMYSQGYSKIFRDQEANYWRQDSVSLSPHKIDAQENIHGYVFSPIPRETNPLKRGRKSKQQQQQQVPESKKNLLDEINNHMIPEMSCSICLGLIYNCVTVMPCLHDFCASCFSELVFDSNKCPNCKKEFEKAKRSSSKNNMVESFLTARPDLRRSKEEYEAKDAKDIIKKLLYVVIEDDESIYRGTMVKNKKEGQGVYEEFEEYTYRGEWKDDEMHGHGKIVYDDGDTYEGDFACGYREGLGRYTYADGDVYDGEWFEGDRQGNGKLQSVDGSVYEGYWVKDKREGKGKLVSIDTGRYEGQWKNNIQEGFGEWSYQDGCTYKGHFMKGLRQGTGRYQWLDGAVYDGEYLEGKREGKGVLITANGTRYDGEWAEDKKGGKGTMTWPDGKVYEGGWFDGKPRGRGKMTWPNGTVYVGDWFNGEEVTQAKSSQIKW